MAEAEPNPKYRVLAKGVSEGVKQGFTKVAGQVKRMKEKANKKRKSRVPQKEQPVTPKKLVIGKPNGLTVKVSMKVDPRATWGISGLPDSWKEMLQKSGVKREKILENHTEAIKVIQFVATGQKNSKIPLPTEKKLKEKMNDTAQIVTRDPATRYVKLDKIGEGAGGVVFKIRFKETNEILAVKISSTEELEYIESEIAYHALSDNHKNIVNYKETFLWDDEVWIVMDFVDGGCLTDILGEDNPEEWTETLIAFVMHECLQALNFMHNQHLLHRDIKSDNVLVSRDGGVKIADFGFAVGLSQENKTRNETVGTPFWMAPEVIQGEDYDDRCDIWSLGITAIELVNHEPPHMDKDHIEALLDIVTLPHPMPHKLDVWSEVFLNFLEMSLKKKFRERWNGAQLLEHEFMGKRCLQKEFAVFVKYVLDERAKMSEAETEEEEEGEGY